MSREIVRSGLEFGKGLWGAILAALAALVDPLEVGKAVNMVEATTTWSLGPDVMRGIFLLVAFGWMFVWFHRQRVKFALSELGPFDMSFSELVGRVALDSHWGRNYDPSRWAHWQGDLRREICGKLTTGEIRARGIEATPLGEASGPTLIETDFWEWVVFEAEFLLLAAIGGEPWTCAKTSEIEPRWRDNVVFQREAVDRIWPRPFFPRPWRKQGPFREWIEEWLAEQEEMANHGPIYQNAFAAQSGKADATRAF